MKPQPVLSFGTLNNPLAKAQTQVVINLLQRHHRRLSCQMTISPSPIPTGEKGDEPYLAASAAEVEYLEEQLLAGEFGFVVQRAADLVLPLRQGVTYIATPPRGTPFDAFLNRQGLIADEMPPESEIGVLNLRTKAQMLQLWPHLNIKVLAGGLHGALEAFLRRCEVDGLLLPAAVAEHLGIQGIVSEIFYPEVMLPSSGQGILVILGREDDEEGLSYFRSIHSSATFREMEAEHAFMQRFATDQDLPVSVLAQVERKRILVTGAISSLRGASNRETLEGTSFRAEQIGVELAERLLSRGEAVIDLLEADFPDGLPAGDPDEQLVDSPDAGFDADPLDE